jgi:opacity protein-like surface antigen
MKRAATFLAIAAAGAFSASAPARADELSMAERILNAVYSDLGLSAKAADDTVASSKNGFFVGVHSGLGAESGLAPVAAGLSIPLNSDLEVDSIAANGYYVFNTDWSLGTYVGGGFGKFNLAEDPLLNSSLPRGNYGYQGMAGLTYSFTPSMVLGLEYRYSEPVNNAYFSQSTLPQNDEENQSVTLRFDFLLN